MDSSIQVLNGNFKREWYRLWTVVGVVQWYSLRYCELVCAEKAGDPERNRGTGWVGAGVSGVQEEGGGLGGGGGGNAMIRFACINLAAFATIL